MKNSRKITFGILTTSKDINKFYNQQKSTCDQILKKYGSLHVLDLSNFLIIKKVKKFKDTKLTKDFIYFKPKNYHELKNFAKNNKIITFNNLGRGFNYLFIYIIINLLKIRLILLFNLGNISNNLIASSNFKSRIFSIKRKFNEFIYKIFLFFKVFPQIDLYFHTDERLINKINLIIKKREKWPFKNIFNYNYIKKCYLVSSRKNSFKIKKKYIIFVDANFYHSDRLMRERKPSIIEEKEYFKSLEQIFKILKKKFKKDVLVCLHPSSNLKIYRKYFSDRVIKIGMTQKLISQSSLVLAHESSLIIDSINLSKPIIILKSENLGNFINQRCLKYINIFKLVHMNIDQNKSVLINKINKLKISRITAKKITTKNVSDKLIIKQMENLN